jgi:hypothetical protein
VTVHDVEQLTGYKLFDQVPSAIIEPLKNKIDAEAIPPPAAIAH